MSHSSGGGNTIAKIAIFVLLALILGAPLLVHRRPATQSDAKLRLTVITPHNEQLRYELGRAFSAWHEREHGEPVFVDWRRPGGTSEIRRQLTAQYVAAVKDGRISPEGDAPAGTMPYDAMLGGGSYEHSKLKEGVRTTVNVDGEERTVEIPISQPVEFSRERLDEWYGENRIKIDEVRLYDPDLFWFGTALSSFGIVYNRDVLQRQGMPEPATWSDLADPAYSGWIILADPRKSGSVTTTLQSILTAAPSWSDGWRLLRAMSANARTFSYNSALVVVEVAQGEAAASLAIDFYGRYQAQMLREASDEPGESRLGYVDPYGAVSVDPDPVSVLRGAPHPEMTRRFIEFLLSVEGQALWQFRAVGPDAGPDALGPHRFELRRMPARRMMYEAPYRSQFIDDVNPFEAASSQPMKGWRALIGPILGASVIDIHAEARSAWDAINRLRAQGAPPERIGEIEDVFFRMPTHELPDGREVDLNSVPPNLGEVIADWRDRDREPILRIRYTDFFRRQYQRVREMASKVEL